MDEPKNVTKISKIQLQRFFLMDFRWKWYLKQLEIRCYLYTVCMRVFFAIFCHTFFCESTLLRFAYTPHFGEEVLIQNPLFVVLISTSWKFFSEKTSPKLRAEISQLKQHIMPQWYPYCCRLLHFSLVAFRQSHLVRRISNREDFTRGGPSD